MQKIQIQEKRFLRNKKKYAKIPHRAIRKKFPHHEQGTTLRFFILLPLNDFIQKINKCRNLIPDCLIFLSRASQHDFSYAIRNQMKIYARPARLQQNTGILYRPDS